MPKTNATTKGSTAAGSAHVIQEEGGSLTQRSKLNFVGAGVTATDDAGNDATVVTIPGGGVGSVSLTEVEIDFGTISSPNTSWTITDALVDATKKILVFLSPNPATDRIGNDWELDSAVFSALSDAGQFTLYAATIGRLIGKRKIYYQII